MSQAKRKAVRTRRNPEEARSLILQAAQRLLATHGPDAIGLKDVAREAGISHALITHYFGTYEGLVEAALESHIRARRAESLDQILGALTSGPDEWIRLAFAQLGEPLTGRLLMWALMTGRVDKDDFFARRDQGMRFVADAIEARLQAELGKEAPSREGIECAQVLVLSAALGYQVARGVLWASLGREPSAKRDRAIEEALIAALSQITTSA